MMSPIDPTSTPSSDNELLQRWKRVRQQILAATQAKLPQANLQSKAQDNQQDKAQANQQANTKQALQPVCLLAVAKTKPASMVATLARAGQTHFGENYLQEALPKIAAVEALLATPPAAPTVVWHYIGHIQRNKTRDIASNFAWVHTLERDIIAKRLSAQRPKHLAKLNVLIQVNIDEEVNKSGCLPEAVAPLINAIKGYDNLCLRGLMIIPAKDPTGSNSAAFQRTKLLFDALGAAHPELSQWDTLSMGMSADLTTAIEHGSTMVRVGSAIFGSRD